MKLKLSPNHLTFRISDIEYNKLTSNATINDKFTFPDFKIFTYSVSVASNNKISLDNGDIYLTITDKQLKELKTATKKTGIKYEYIVNNKKMKISLEIDLTRC